MNTIVSITPTRLEADSRTYKIAASFRRFGFVSIVVEGQPSALDPSALPFELRTIRDFIFRNRREIPWEQTMPATLQSVTGKILRTLADPTPLLPFLFLFWYLLRGLVVPLKYIPKASLYYLHEYSLYPAVHVLSKRHNAPIVYDAHDFYGAILSPKELAKRGFGWRCVMAFNRRIESHLVRNASAVVTVSKGIADLYEHTFGRRPIVIRNCHDLRIDREPVSNLRESLALSSGQFLVVAVGNCKPGMAIRETLEAMTELPPDVHLAFVGRFYDEYLPDIRRRHLQDRVHIVGPVKPFELVPFVGTADAAILPYYARSPNYKNCLPNGLFQSIAAMLPILYPSLPEIKGIAERYSIGTSIEPLVPRSISTAIIALANDVQRMSQCKMNLAVAAQDLTWEKEETVLEDLVLRTLGQ
jgi:glycosyltransferase involved in cell wall biosynthesis